MPLTITTQNDLKYDLTSQKRTSLNQTNDHLDFQVYVQIRVTKHSLQTQSSRHFPDKNETQPVLRWRRTNNHSKPSWNQIDFIGGRSHRRTTANNFMSTILASCSFLLQERNKKWCSPNTNDIIHPSSQMKIKDSKTL